MKSDLTIAQEAHLKPIMEIAESLGLSADDIELYGKYKAKIPLSILDRYKDRPDGKLILVTAITPTPAGEGKTTTTIGLGQAFHRMGKKAIVALREPSLGPVFGLKGGATGGGRAQVLPMEEINLHFTGDFHAISAAHNLLAAIVDNHIHQGNALHIDPRKVVWKRVLDLNDRALRQVIIGLGGTAHGVPRESGFDITVASEVMAILCLAQSLKDLTQRMKRIVVAYTYDNQPVTAGDLEAAGAMTVLLKDAIKPNLVQTLENTPALVHGGPFANIAHGCNSLLATRMALKLADYVITEAGFGADLGAEKFFHIACRTGGLQPEAAVVVATVRALKMHGGVKKDALARANPAAVSRGLGNLAKHVETIHQFGLPCVVAINRFPTDTEEELRVIWNWCEEQGIPGALSEVWEKGGEGGVAVVEKLLELLQFQPGRLTPLYPLDASLEEKISIIAQRVYGAAEVRYSDTARRQMDRLIEEGYDQLPVCIAKTPYSLSDRPGLFGRPEGFTLNVRELKVSAGAGFVVVLTGEILTMPGLPKEPAALHMWVDEDGHIHGLF